MQATRVLYELPLIHTNTMTDHITNNLAIILYREGNAKPSSLKNIPADPRQLRHQAWTRREPEIFTSLFCGPFPSSISLSEKGKKCVAPLQI